ncbi:MAG: hypothetical protein A2Z14_18980 [Chloroflexi bacterium RBG_16_48_8]|nr:MAG: hypothetical protein A2Z14_18980 [Chloroflexi bacterium RBG_16_48_8]
MKIRLITVTIVVILVGFVAACTNGEEETTSTETISIISLKENLPTLEQQGKSWRRDSYLACADVSVWFEQPENAVLITAAFNSPSSEFESLLVNLKADGSLSVKPIRHEIPVIYQEPIT